MPKKETNSLILKHFIKSNVSLVSDAYSKAKDAGELSKIYDLEWDSEDDFSVFFHLETSMDNLVGYASQLTLKRKVDLRTINIEAIRLLKDSNLILWMDDNTESFPHTFKYIFALANLKLSMQYYINQISAL